MKLSYYGRSADMNDDEETQVWLTEANTMLMQI